MTHHTTGASLHSMSRAAMAELQSYLGFEPGWDSYSGVRFSSDVIAAAQEVVQAASRWFARLEITPTEITPAPASDGTVDVEFVVGGREVTMTFDPDLPTVHVYMREVHVLALRPDEESEQDIQCDRLDLERLFRWVAAGER